MEPSHKGKRTSLIGEMVFVLVIILLLKEWVFPWLIWQWFPIGDDAARMLEWMVIMVAVVTCFAYAGFGSVSAHIYGNSATTSTAVWGLLHLPVLASFTPLHAIPLLREIAHTWNGLIGDGMRLFIPELPAESGVVPMIALLFFWMGRVVKVSEGEVGKQQQKQGRSAS